MRRKKGHWHKTRWQKIRKQTQEQKRLKERNQQDQKKGYENEHRVEEALLRQKHQLPFEVVCHNAFHNGELDRHQIDMVVGIVAAPGLIFLLQIKSSASAMAKHCHNHPLMPVMVANAKMFTEEIVMEVLRKIREHSELPFEPEVRYDVWGSSEIKNYLGANTLIVLQNGFGLLLRKDSGTTGSNRRARKDCPIFPVVRIPEGWDEEKLASELPKIIEDRRKLLLAALEQKRRVPENN